VVQNTTNLVSANFWHHLALSYSSTSGNGRIYLDGAIVAEQNIGTFVPRTAGNLFIGRRASPGFEESFQGLIDEPSVYRRELAPAEVQSIFSAGSAGKCKTAVAPLIVSQPESQTVMAGNSVSFSVVASGTAPLRYQWRFVGTNLSGATNATLFLGNVQTDEAGAYSVVVANSVNSVTSSNATLTVNPPPNCL